MEVQQVMTRIALVIVAALVVVVAFWLLVGAAT